jgi:hypothetical protein
MMAHLQKCLAESGGAKASFALLIRAQAAQEPMYWLDLAVKPTATLKDVDEILRSVWLECCGHLSEFYYGALKSVAMGKKVVSVLGEAGARIGYIYDYGSSTELLVSHGRAVSAALDRSVCLMARNEPPTWLCEVCGEVATQICVQCACDGVGLLCEAHSETHNCGEQMLLPVVNSPRMGVCAYQG